MRRHKKRMHLAGAICLVLVLLMNICASAAADSVSSSAKARQEDLNFLYENLKTYHPNLFANTPEKTFLARKAEIESRLKSESDTEFVLDMQSLVALIRDSHTQMPIGSIANDTGFYPMEVVWFDGHWVLSAVQTDHKELLGMQVSAMNGLPMDQVLERFSKLISADNPVKLRRQYRQACNVEALYRYVGIVKDNAPLTLTLRGDTGEERTLTLDAMNTDSLKELSVSSLVDQRKAAPATAAQNKYYFSTELNSDTYYIQYNKCAEDPELPMETFCTQVKSALDAGNYKLVLVDLRNNGGGSDGVIGRLLLLLEQEMFAKDLQVAALVGEATFSSAVINAVELQEMGCVLAGETASGSVNHFGSVSGFQLPNSGIKVQVSSKYIALSDLLDAAAGKGVEALTPDVEIPQTLEDYLAGKDTCVEKILADPACLIPAEQESVPLTRGRFVGMLYSAAGSPSQTLTKAPFSDLLGIEWYLPALNWAASEKIALGTVSNRFVSARLLSWQEAAAFLVRSVQALRIEPTVTVDSQPPEALLAGAWDKGVIEQAWKWGLLPQDADFTAPPTRAQGKAMTDALIPAQ